MKTDHKKHVMSARDAQKMAHIIAFAPVVFQVTRLMVKWGILELLEKTERETGKGLGLEDVAEHTGLSLYAVKVLMESSFTTGVVAQKDDTYVVTKIGWFLGHDEMVKVNMDFNHDVNYKGLFHLEEALRTATPAGLKELGNWPTIYEGLSSLPKPASDSWFAFDHHYSDVSFEQALEIVFAGHPGTLLDIGGNTGKFALKCVTYNPDVHVTIFDLPQQIGLMKGNTSCKPGAERIGGHPGNLLDDSTRIPAGYDVVWMSQFLDCFSEEQVSSILKRVAASFKETVAMSECGGNACMTADGAHGNALNDRSGSKFPKLYIMETLWDRQVYDTAAFDIAQTSVYFTAMANGNSKMFNSRDLFRLIESAGFRIDAVYDGLGEGHSLIACSLVQ